MGFVLRAFIAGVLAFIAAGPRMAAAQAAFATKPITIVVPAAAGGPTDTVARLVAASMTRTLGQTVLIENVGGAGGTIAMGRVVKAAPDGYTLAVWHIAQATAPALYESIRYDVVNDFDHLGRITDVPMTLVSKTGVNFDSLDGEPVHVFVMLVSPNDRPGDHLRALENVSRCLRDDSFVKALRNAADANAIWELLTDEQTGN